MSYLLISQKKAFASIHRATLGQILRGYGFPQKTVLKIIKMVYEDFQLQSSDRNQTGLHFFSSPL